MAGKKIDYKEYLKTFGNIETDAKNRIKAYLEEQIENDAALKALYRPEKIDDCYDFIEEAVRATGKSGFVSVEDAVVFKMARDYYLDILPKQTDEPGAVNDAGAETAAEDKAEAETEPETEEEENPADNENKADSEPENEKPAEKTDVMPHQADSEGESVESEKGEAETEAATEEEKPSDNENEAVTDEYGFEVFGEEVPEEGAETAAKPENEKPEPDTPKYDNEGNGLLFDF